MGYVDELPSAPHAPSAPPEDSIYPHLPNNAGDFRLLKINEIAQSLDNEVQHYRLVAKKYKRAKKFVGWSAGGSSVVSAVFSSASLGSALSVVALPAAVPLGGVGGCFALISSALIIACRKLETKIKKHHEITTLAVSKRDTVNRLLSKALANNNVSAHEFDTILSEFERYNFLKEQVRSKIHRQPSKRKLPEVDVKKIEKDIRAKVEAESQKKIADMFSLNSR